jgi:hypothetical protein
MMKNKVYRPRRGLHFTDDPSSNRPVACYIGTAAVTRTRPTTSKTTMQLHTTDSVNVYGQVQFSGVGPSGVIYGVQATQNTGSGPPPVTLQSITISPSPALIT